MAFISGSTNLIEGDTNGRADIFVRDLNQGLTVRVSVSSEGEQANGDSGAPSISGDGHYVVFSSPASNLVPGDRNGKSDIFVRDLEDQTTTRVSVSTSGREGNDGSVTPAISGDGRYVAFHSYASTLVRGDTATCEVYGETTNCLDVFVHDIRTGRTEKVSVSSDERSGACMSAYSSISRDGRFVAFWSECSALVPGDHNGVADIFVRDRQRGETTRVSVASDGSEGDDAARVATAISADGRYVAFASWASNMVAGDTLRCPNREEPDGTRNCSDVFVHDRTTGKTTMLSVAPDGSQGNDRSSGPSISADGRYVAFESAAGNLVPDDHNDYCGEEDPRPVTCWDIFVRDRKTGTTLRASVASDGTEGNTVSHSASISSYGKRTAFESLSSNLVAGDTNGANDIFVHEFGSGETWRASVG